MTAVAQVGVEIRDPGAARANALHADVADPARQVGEELGLEDGGGSEVGVAAFRWMRLVADAIPSQKGFAEAGIADPTRYYRG